MASLVDRIEKLDNARAIALLLEAWARTPSVAIADAIDALDTEPAFSGDAKTWLSNARTKPRGPLLRGMRGQTGDHTVEMMKVAVKWRDPRLTHAIHALLSDMPWAGARSRSVWREIFAVLGKLGDPRWLALATLLPAKWSVGKPLQTWLSNQLREALEGMELVAHAEEAKLVAYAAALRATAPPRETAPRNASALLAAIYANPDDDAARLVYADWLQERGDPRGEFIALQLHATPDKKRINELVKQHKKAWLGPLANALRGEVEFRRGFPAKGVATFRHQADVEQWGSLVEWATIEELEYSNAKARIDQQEWAHYIGPAMTNLRIVHRPSIVHLFATKTPWRLESIDLYAKHLAATHIQQLVTSALFPKLERLHLVGWGPEPSWFATITKCPPHLSISHSPDREDFADWISAAEKTQCKTFTFETYDGTTWRFSRDAKRKLSQLEVAHVPRTAMKKAVQLDKLVNLLAGIEVLRAKSLTKFSARVLVGGAMVVVPEIDAAAKSKLA